MGQEDSAPFDRKAPISQPSTLMPPPSNRIVSVVSLGQDDASKMVNEVLYPRSPSPIPMDEMLQWSEAPPNRRPSVAFLLLKVMDDEDRQLLFESFPPPSQLVEVQSDRAKRLIY